MKYKCKQINPIVSKQINCLAASVNKYVELCYALFKVDIIHLGLILLLQKFIRERNYPKHVNVTKVHETGEPSEFISLFKVWEKMRIPGQVYQFI